jgi:hypothetical protein
MMVASMSSNSKERNITSKVEVCKKKAQAIILKPMNESRNVALAKMEKEAKILTVDLSTMDPLAKAW